ncbi:MAG: CGNR zinc finger domain-containing protein [Streptosporangiaceae bacterium]|nr:CGNR zinc finger domain-containing protein [Streptosporangiaceae bacterium]MBV9855876.1 CGNR zinc finger domain-containing protein [Streptosporangiaceae bacterium]
MRLPSWVPELQTKHAPMPLLLVQSFVNTRDPDEGTDMLASMDGARAWLADAGLLGPGAARDGEIRRAREVRESIRALIARNGAGLGGGGEPMTAEQLRPLEAALAEARPRLAVGADGGVRLDAGSSGRLADGILRLLLIIRDAQADGTWSRLKLCTNRECQWAFFDRSHSRRGAWCDMATCGNKIKNRNLRARRAQEGRGERTAG